MDIASQIHSMQTAMDTISNNLEAQMAQFNSRMDSLTASNSPRISEAAPLQLEFAAFVTFTKESICLLKQQMDLLAHGLDSLEMRSRLNVLLFHGINEHEKENVTDMITDKLHNTLKLKGLASAGIVKCHRLGAKRAGATKPRPVLVRFHSYQDRSSTWKSKTLLKGSGVTMSEFLTATRHATFMEARKRFNVNNCWTQDGHIIVAHDGVRHKIESMDELKKLCNKFSLPPTLSTTNSKNGPNSPSTNSDSKKEHSSSLSNRPKRGANNAKEKGRNK